MKRFFALIGFLALAAAPLTAADVTGKWTGSFPFNDTTVALTFDLKTSGSALTGTVGGLPTASVEIKDGKIDGAKLTFWVVTDYQGSPVKLVYAGEMQARRSSSPWAPKTAVGARSWSQSAVRSLTAPA